MARVPMVTRTIITTKVNVLCLNIATGEPFNQQVDLPRTYKDEAHVLKQVKKVVDNDIVKVVHVTSYEEVETLYGMTEQKFIDTADKLPPRGSKEAEEQEDTTTNEN